MRADGNATAQSMSSIHYRMRRGRLPATSSIHYLSSYPVAFTSSDEIAAAVLSLCSPSASFVLGVAAPGVHLPDAVDFETAAAMMLKGLTAHIRYTAPSASRRATQL